MRSERHKQLRNGRVHSGTRQVPSPYGVVLAKTLLKGKYRGKVFVVTRYFSHCSLLAGDRESKIIHCGRNFIVADFVIAGFDCTKNTMSKPIKLLKMTFKKNSFKS